MLSIEDAHKRDQAHQRDMREAVALLQGISNRPGTPDRVRTTLQSAVIELMGEIGVITRRWD